MPIYEYHCANCNQDLELIRKVSEVGDRTCPQCNSPSLVKQTSMTAFHLKGGGWYADGYSGGQAGEGAKTGSNATGSSAATGAGEGKPSSEAAKPAAESPKPASSDSKSA